MSADARQKPIKITWTADKLIGNLTIGGEHWAAVEWSEKRQPWCIEDAEGRCLKHLDHVHGENADRNAAVALAEAMIRDGRMPDPETAWKNLLAEKKRRREKRERQPAQIRKRQQERERRDQRFELSRKEWEAKAEEESAPPLYEMLADAFDFADPDLWKSNSFASLRPRLVIHVRHVIAKLESSIDYEIRRGRSQPFCGLGATTEQRKRAAADRTEETSAAIRKLQQKLDRAREILSRLEAAEAS
jgi:hypothetical protein